jgi:hypothetical protein
MIIPPARPYTENSELSLPWHTYFIGQHMQHNYWLYAVIDRVMMANPQIRSVVELGTGAGAVSMVFGLWGIKKEMPVLTFDNVVRHDTKMLEALKVRFCQLDIFSEEAAKEMQGCIGDTPTWLFCDGGFKGKELQTFSPNLPKGSIISAHDLGTEFKHDYHAAALCREGVIEPYHPEWWMENNIQLALYKKL